MIRWELQQKVKAIEALRDRVQQKAKKARVLLGLTKASKPVQKPKVRKQPFVKPKALVEPYGVPRWVEKYDASKHFDNSGNFIEALKKKGYKLLGKGYYSAVLGKEGSDRVLKVIRQPEDGWLDYIHWASRNGYAGSFAPKVYSYKYIKKGGFGVAVMERLERTLSSPTFPEDDAIMVSATLFDKIARHHSQTSAWLLEVLHPGLGEFGLALSRKYESFDLHRENYMVRSDGTLVVTDPVSDSGSSAPYFRRMRARDFLSPVPNFIRMFIIGNSVRYRSQPIS